MGWLFPYGATRKSLIADRTQPWERQVGEMLVRSECLKHCFRGGSFRGVLWTVWRRTFVVAGVEVQKEERWIGCDLFQYSKDNDGFGYKDMTEAEHPYFYSCPLGYLSEVPIDKFGGNEEWRAIVIEHQRRQAEKRKPRAIII
jgi:hypothetical protein